MDEHRHTPLPYSREEAAKLREAVARPGTEAIPCPHCSGTVTIGYPVGGGTVGDFWEAHCSTCMRSVILGGVARERRP